MAKFIYLFVFLVALVSCEGNSYQMASTSMQGTIAVNKYIITKPVSKIERNEIIVFQHQDDNMGKQNWVFRVIGLPGDSLEIRNSLVFVNKKQLSIPHTLHHSYKVMVKENIKNKLLTKYQTQKVNSREYIFHMSKNDAEILESLEEIAQVESLILPAGDAEYGLFGAKGNSNWNRDNYGPIVVPDASNSTDSKFFVMGDNRHNAVDSRYFGFVDMKDIIGAVIIR